MAVRKDIKASHHVIHVRNDLPSCIHEKMRQLQRWLTKSVALSKQLLFLDLSICWCGLRQWHHWNGALFFCLTSVGGARSRASGRGGFCGKWTGGRGARSQQEGRWKVRSVGGGVGRGGGWGEIRSKRNVSSRRDVNIRGRDERIGGEGGAARRRIVHGSMWKSRKLFPCFYIREAIHP